MDEKLKNVEDVYIAVGGDLSLGSVYDQQIKRSLGKEKWKKHDTVFFLLEESDKVYLLGIP